MLRSINKRHRETVAAYIKRKLSGGRNMATLERCEKQRFTLDELQAIIKAGKARDYMTEGNQIYLLFDGKEVSYDVIGIDVEKPATQNVKHTVTIQAHTLLEERVYNSKGNDWKSSEMREYLNSTAFFERFGEDLRPYLAPVIKDVDGEESTELIFLLSKEEFKEDTTPYPYYKKEINRVKADENGCTDWHITRSAYRGYGCYAWSVYTSGYVVCYSAACNAWRCAPACAIG